MPLKESGFERGWKGDKRLLRDVRDLPCAAIAAGRGAFQVPDDVFAVDAFVYAEDAPLDELAAF